MASGLRRWVRLLPEASVFRVLVCYLVFLGSIQVATISLSLGRVFLNQTLAIGVSLLALILSVCAWITSKNSGPNLETAFAGQARMPLIVFILGLTCLSSYPILWVLSYLQVDASWDSLAYHIPAIHLWAREGHITWVDPRFPWAEYINGYPKAVELVGFVLGTALDSSHVLNTVNLLFLPLGVLGITYLARALGARSEAAIMAGGAFLLVPLNIRQAATVYVDTAYACCVIATLAALFQARSELRTRSSVARRTALTCGGAMGLAMGIKGTGIALALIVSGVLFLTFLFDLPIVNRPDRRRFLVEGAATILLVGAVAVIVGGYWYGRNYWHTGTPLYPAGITIGNYSVFPGLTLSEAINEPSNTPDLFRTWPAYIRIVFTWLQAPGEWPASIRGYDSRMGGLGFLWVIGCIPSIAYVCYVQIRARPSTWHTDSILPLLVVTTLAFLATPMNWWTRYTIWLYGLGLPCLAVLLTRVILNARPKYAHLTWLSLVAALMLYEGTLCIYDVGYTTVRQRTVEPSGVLNPTRWLYPSSFPAKKPATTAMDRVLADSQSAVAISPLSFLQDKHLIIGGLSQPIGSREIVPLTERPTQEELQALADRGVRYVLWDDQIEVPASLMNRARRIDHADGFWVLSLEHD